MLFEALFLAFALGSENAERQLAARKVSEWRNDTDAQRKEFFAYKKRWGEDKFVLFGQIGKTNGGVFQWNDAIEKIELLEDGYFPYAMSFKFPIEDQDLRKNYINGFEYKVVPNDYGEYARLYLKLSDVEKYILHRNSTGSHYLKSSFEEIPFEIRSLFYEGKMTIGVPYGSGVGSNVPCQAMTFKEAREFMDTMMEKCFQAKLY